MQSLGPICQLNNLSWRTPLFRLLLLMTIFSMSFSSIPQQTHCIQVCGDHLQTRDCSLLSHHLTGKKRWQSLSLVYWEIQKRFKSYQHHHHKIKKDDTHSLLMTAVVKEKHSWETFTHQEISLVTNNFDPGDMRGQIIVSSFHIFRLFWDYSNPPTNYRNPNFVNVLQRIWLERVGMQKCTREYFLVVNSLQLRNTTVEKMLLERRGTFSLSLVS